MKLSNRTIQTVLLAVVSGIASGFLFRDDRVLLPGAVFGLLFGLVNLDKKPLLYAILSGAIYFIAAWIALGSPQVAGAFGALALALVTPFFMDLPPRFDRGGIIRTTLIGAVAGSLFYPAVHSGDRTPYLAFTIWQVAVAWSLEVSIEKQFTVT